jgi:hypothetical protein
MTKSKAFVLFTFFLSITPKEYFGDSYSEAEYFCKQNKYLISSQLETNEINTCIAISVVFPELIRYNRLSNLAETTSLELIYIKEGTSGCDFSIGRFQMKPSFIEDLEIQIKANSVLNKKYLKTFTYPAGSIIQDVRKQRIERLKSFTWQLDYLSCFTDICKLRWSTLYSDNPVEFVKLSSAAYNMSLKSTDSELQALAGKKNWPYGKFVTGRFSYPDVAVYFFDNGSKSIFNN